MDTHAEQSRGERWGGQAGSKARQAGKAGKQPLGAGSPGDAGWLTSRRAMQHLTENNDKECVCYLLYTHTHTHIQADTFILGYVHVIRSDKDTDKQRHPQTHTKTYTLSIHEE